MLPPAENFEQALEGGKKLTALVIEQLKEGLGLAPRSALSMQQQINRQLATMRAAHAAELRRRPDDDGSGETNDFEAEAAAAEEAEQNKGDLMLAQIELKNLREKAAAQAEELDQCKIKLQQAQAKAKEQAQALQQAKARPPSSGPSSGRPASGASRPPSAGQLSLGAQAHSQRAAQVSESYPPEQVAEVYQDMLQVSLEEKEQLKQHSQAEIEAAREAAVAAAAATHHQEMAFMREEYEFQISQLQARSG